MRAAKPLVVLIPGNPGDAGFYDDFVERLRSRGHEVVVTSHPAWLTAPDSLLPYAAHHAEAARRHLAGRGRSLDDTEVVLVGHSVGAYLAYLIVAHDLLPAARVFMLFPFLARPAPSGRIILATLGRLSLYRAGLSAFRLLPSSLRRWLVSWGGGGAQAPRVLSALAAPTALAYAVMAGVERREIAARPDVAYLREHAIFGDAHRFVPMFCARDRWATAALAAQLGSLAYHFARPVSHAFVVHPEQSERVAAVLDRFLRGEDPRQDPESRSSSSGRKRSIGDTAPVGGGCMPDT